jgi:iron-sulfur cluster assembly protein|tara:strand:- start:953 stop:1279 length:327 start_codon:yes stop_codon:yes gene_type:complete
MIKITEKALEKLKELRTSENYNSDYNVRVKVKGGGCSGLMYDLDFDNKTSDKDNFFEDNGIKIVVDKKSLFYILDTELDFSDGLNGKGFQFKNPNATRTCGCGESFAV